MNETEVEFLKESNAIEGEYSKEALEDAMDAWAYAKENRHKITIKTILRIHELLMRRLNFRIAGHFRKVAVQVGSKYCPRESVYNLKKKLQTFLAWDKTGLGAEEDIKRAHVFFEDIHPFEDGNGRTGRILMNAQRLNFNLPILVIKEAEKQEYYKWFKKEWELFPCKKCGAPTTQKYCDECYGSRCRSCGKSSYGETFCNWCMRSSWKRR